MIKGPSTDAGYQEGLEDDSLLVSLSRWPLGIICISCFSLGQNCHAGTPKHPVESYHKKANPQEAISLAVKTPMPESG